MNGVVDIALFGWIPVVLLIFSLLPPTRAVIVSFLAAWMFLPMSGFSIPGLPDYTKTSAATYAVLLGMFIFDAPRVAKFRPSLLDLPMAVWVGVSYFSSISAGYGSYDGVASVLNKLIVWGVPYFIGRIYLSDLRSMRELALGLFIGGLVYVPLCIFEMRFSPQLHAMVYGFHQHDFAQTRRGGGYRPTVFMQHGLAVGTFMCTAALVGLWLWRSKAVRMLWGLPMGWLVFGVTATAVMCRSTGSTALLLLGIAVLMFTQLFRTSLAVVALIAAPVIYLLARTVGGWTGHELVELASMISEDRAGSISTRLASETALWHRVQPQLLLGAARFTFMGMDLEEGETAIIPDGMWLIALGVNGLIGLASFVALLLLPPLAFLRKAPGRVWAHPVVAPGAVVAIAVTLYMCDSLFNAMLNPLFVVAAGGLTSIVISSRRAARVTPVRRPAAAGRQGVSGRTEPGALA